MSSSKTLSVSYAVYPPPEVAEQGGAAGALPPTASSSKYPIPSPAPSTSQAASSTASHYAALGPILRTAQKEINDTLTAWKDAIGDKEKSKEDPGTIGFGRGKAAMMSEDVQGDLRGQSAVDGEDDDESSDEA